MDLKLYSRWNAGLIGENLAMPELNEIAFSISSWPALCHGCPVQSCMQSQRVPERGLNDLQSL